MIAALAGCTSTSEDENPAWNPQADFPGWAYDSPVYYEPAQELKPAETVGNDIPIFYCRDDSFFIRHPKGVQKDILPRMAVWYSENGGTHWGKNGYYGLEQKYFLFRAERDGAFWIRFVGPGQGPSEVPPGQPNQIYVVDTRAPNIQLNVYPGPWEDEDKTIPHVYHVGDTVTLDWTVSEPYLVSNSIRLSTCFAKFPHNVIWSRFKEVLSASGSMRVTIPSGAASQAGLRFRLVAKDKAGNIGIGMSPIMMVSTSGRMDTPMPPAAVSPPAAIEPAPVPIPAEDAKPRGKMFRVDEPQAVQPKTPAKSTEPVRITGPAKPQGKVAGAVTEEPAPKPELTRPEEDETPKKKTPLTPEEKELQDAIEGPADTEKQKPSSKIRDEHIQSTTMLTDPIQIAKAPGAEELTPPLDLLAPISVEKRPEPPASRKKIAITATAVATEPAAAITPAAEPKPQIVKVAKAAPQTTPKQKSVWAEPAKVETQPKVAAVTSETKPEVEAGKDDVKEPIPSLAILERREAAKARQAAQAQASANASRISEIASTSTNKNVPSTGPEPKAAPAPKAVEPKEKVAPPKPVFELYMSEISQSPQAKPAPKKAKPVFELYSETAAPAKKPAKSVLLSNIPERVQQGWPAAGTILRGGVSRLLNWMPESRPYKKIKLQFSSNNGRAWITVATGLRKGRAAMWTVPVVNSKKCRLRIVGFNAAGRKSVLITSKQFSVDTGSWKTIDLSGFKGK
ncbi:MAG: hypothetical protein K8S55_05605 [Phycisphaerae bacterium]|nr:hypothetical protein [Phycisphaerae bacterium]